MSESRCYENYPLRIVALSNLVQFALYLAGAFVIYQIGLAWLALYLLFILGLEVRVMRKSCVNCYYYGRFCAFGKGADHLDSRLHRRLGVCFTDGAGYRWRADSKGA